MLNDTGQKSANFAAKVENNYEAFYGPSADAPREEVKVPLVGTGSWLGRGGGVLITLPLYFVLWSATEIVNDATGYVVFGVSLMLWPCQWAFDLGRSAAPPNKNDVPTLDAGTEHPSE